MTECSSKSSCGDSGACSSCASRGRSMQKIEARKQSGGSPGVQTLFIMSGKGGVGKSAVTVNLALALVRQGNKVGILDVDIHGPSIPSLLGLKEKLKAQDTKMLAPVHRGDNLSVISMDSLLDNRDTAIIWRGPKKTAAIRQFVTGVAWGQLDYLLVDSPPGTGDEHLAVLAALPEAKCIMVTTPQEVALADVRKALHFLHRSNATLLGLVENMSGLACPHCGGNIDLFTSGGGEKLAQQQGVTFLGAIPIDPLVVLAANEGKGIVELDTPSKAKDAFMALAEKIVACLKSMPL